MVGHPRAPPSSCGQLGCSLSSVRSTSSSMQGVVSRLGLTHSLAAATLELCGSPATSQRFSAQSPDHFTAYKAHGLPPLGVCQDLLFP